MRFKFTVLASRLRRIREHVPFLLPLVLVACGTTNPPAELVSARSAYNNAAAGQAAQLAPGELHDAKIALNNAERKFSDEGDSWKTKDLSYVAEQKAKRADVVGRTSAANNARSSAEKERTKILTALAARGQNAEELARKAREEANATKSELAEKEQKLGEERAAREAAEARADQAIEELAKTEAVKKEPRGVVITLSGSVLFAFGKAEILPSARKRLDEVADALKSSPDKTFVVEGHTDSVGDDTANLALSQKRADAVRAYLVSQGVLSDKIRAVGRGETTPVDTNTTADGRAINRRVEIVVQSGMGGGPPEEK